MPDVLLSRRRGELDQQRGAAPTESEGRRRGCWAELFIVYGSVFTLARESARRDALQEQGSRQRVA